MIEVSEVVDDDNEELTGKTLVRKDNTLITAKYKSTLLENQITTVCLSRVRKQGDKYIASITTGELKKLLGLNGNNTSLYSRLITVAKNVSGRMLVVENGEEFDVINVITDASYHDGVFSMRFNDKMNPFFSNLKGRYTTYALANIISFKYDYSFRIYEVIKKEAWRVTAKNPVVTVQYGLSEFECMIGMVDINTDRIKREMGKKNVDWDKVIEMAPERSYPRWIDFRRYVLDRAREEVNSLCDVAFDYTPVRKGRGGKVAGIKLHIRKNNITERAEIKTKQEQFERLNVVYEENGEYVPSPELLRYIGHNELKHKDIQTFLNDAGGNDSLVIHAIELADSQENIKNYVGWIRSCIRQGGYEDIIPVSNGSSAEARKAIEFQESVDDRSEAIASGYWKKLKAKHGGRFDDFVRYIEKSGLTLEMFEAANTEAECAEKYFVWFRGEHIELI